MNEIIPQVLILLRGAWRYRWHAVATAWLVAIAGWIGVQLMPDKYASETQVYVDTESLLKPLLTGLAVNRDVMSQVSMMQAVMLSRPNLEKVAQRTDLLLDARTPEEQEDVIDSLSRRINLARSTGRRDANTFVVSFEDNDPAVAHRVVQTLLDTFMEDSLGLKRTDAGAAQRFLQSQLREYEAKLREAEMRLAAFKQQNVGLMPGFGGDYYQRLETETGTLQQMQRQYSQLQNRRNELARQLQGEEPTFGLMGEAEAKPIDGQIARFRAQRDQLLLSYTEKHPQVRAIDETIARLEEEKRSGATVSRTVAPPGADGSGGTAAASLDANPVYQNLRLSLSQTDADLAEIRGQISSQESVVAGLRGRINAIPEVEAELARLNRDYEVNQKQYDTLLQRLESARISEQAEQSAENVKFRVIEPPTKPVKPTGPMRAALNSLVLLGAFAAGLALAIGMAQLHPTFITRDALQKIAGIPVLGAVTAAVREDVVPWYSRQAVLVGAAVGLLLVTYLLNLVLSDPLRVALRGLVG